MLGGAAQPGVCGFQFRGALPDAGFHLQAAQGEVAGVCHVHQKIEFARREGGALSPVDDEAAPLAGDVQGQGGHATSRNRGGVCRTGAQGGEGFPGHREPSRHRPEGHARHGRVEARDRCAVVAACVLEGGADPLADTRRVPLL